MEELQKAPLNAASLNWRGSPTKIKNNEEGSLDVFLIVHCGRGVNQIKIHKLEGGRQIVESKRKEMKSFSGILLRPFNFCFSLQVDGWRSSGSFLEVCYLFMRGRHLPTMWWPTKTFNLTQYPCFRSPERPINNCVSSFLFHLPALPLGLLLRISALVNGRKL